MYKRNLEKRFKILTEVLKQKFDYLSLYDAEDSNKIRDDGHRINSLMEEKHLLADSNRIARETVSKGSEILSTLGRSSDMMRVSQPPYSYTFRELKSALLQSLTT